MSSTYADPSLTHLNEEIFQEVHPFDWPVLFFLRKFIDELGANSLIDFGGHVGVKFTAFRELLALPSDFGWVVVEMPPMVEAGRARARSLGLTNLTFTESLNGAGPAKILLCSGVLQSTPETLGELLEAADCSPDVVILNKLPLGETGGFFTLENFGARKLVHRIFDPAAHDEMRERLGYRRFARWRVPYRDFEIPFAQPEAAVRMIGEVWTRG